MTRRYLLCPGTIVSRVDRDRHYIGARQLAFLYGVQLHDCIVHPDGDSACDQVRRSQLSARVSQGELTPLYPRASGDYTLPPPGRGCA